jgi:hypothetical protein
MMIVNSISNVVLSNCPLLRSFMNDTGILFVNKTIMPNMESPIHCQWLVASSVHQVRKFYRSILFSNSIFSLYSVLWSNLIMY